MYILNVPEEEAKCTESQLDILLKIHDGQYRLVKKNKRSSVWNVYREIARPDGTKLKWRYYCLGCKRVMQSTGGTTSNLRIHKCHVRYLKQHGKDDELPKYQRIASRHTMQRMPATNTANRRQTQTYDEDSDEPEAEAAEEEEDYEESELSGRAGQTAYVSIQQLEHMDASAEISFNAAPNEPRPLLKLFSEDESWSPETIEEQQTLTQQQPHSHQQQQSHQQQAAIVEIDPATEDSSQDFSKETIHPNPTHTMQIDASALSEAESYARAWAHTFLKLSEDQKFYAKRSIDELLVLGRLERLNISTVTSLTTNL
ncbi:GH14652 [Drosophila grimshawi]|uniref:GH14652 n=2 Tax=Drosophila grimshawi TaxID=7222 RepID=B4IXR3_DROGR|nr:GH14652 [Drosophila grimshawi]